MPSNDRFRTQNVEWQARLQGVALAGFRARATAFLIDAAAIGIILSLPSVWDQFRGPAKPRLTFSLEFGGLVSIAIAVAYFALGTYFGKGSTPGKRLLGVRVVSLTHSHMSLWHCVERALGYAASFLEGGFGFVQYFLHPNHQTVHDRIAETIVVAVPGRRQAPGPDRGRPD
jgi:uncharacterized RDD family membrane protein YckC